MALSGGSTPAPMVSRLSACDVPWAAVQLLQVDERQVSADDPDRNWSMFRPLAEVIAPENRHPMPVEAADADVRYSELLQSIAGNPPQLDVVHLGLGADGHTASLVPGDLVVDIDDRSVSWVDPYRGHRRLTLTLPVLRNARCQIWLVAGADKADAVRELTSGQGSTPAAKVLNRDTATLFIDAAASTEDS